MVLDLDDQAWRSCFALLKLNEIKLSRVKPLKNSSEKLGLHLGLYDRKWGGVGLNLYEFANSKSTILSEFEKK